LIRPVPDQFIRRISALPLTPEGRDRILGQGDDPDGIALDLPGDLGIGFNIKLFSDGGGDGNLTPGRDLGFHITKPFLHDNSILI
jgi:hypothetical protein